MASPVTTSEVLLQQAVDLLTEVRDLLRQAPPTPAPITPSKPPAARRTAPRKPKE